MVVAIPKDSGFVPVMTHPTLLQGTLLELTAYQCPHLGYPVGRVHVSFLESILKNNAAIEIKGSTILKLMTDSCQVNENSGDVVP